MGDDMKLITIIAACGMLLATSSAHADDIVPDVLMQPAQSSVPGRAIDIRGLVQGMSIEEARAALVAADAGALRERTYSTSLSSKGHIVRSAPYVKWLGIGGDTDKLSATLSGISSGNQITLINRHGDYRNDREAAPLFDDFVDALVDKYGDPSFRRDGASVTHLMWTYKDGEPAPCDPDGTPQCLPPESAFSYLPERAEFFDVILAAKVGRERGHDRVLAFQLSLTDLSIKAAADIADEAGMRPALDAAIAESAANAPKPSL